MSDNVQIALISALAVAIPALLAQFLMHLRNSKKLEEIHIQTNSNLDEQKKEVKEVRTEIKDLNKHMQVLAEGKGRAEAKAEGKSEVKSGVEIEGTIEGKIAGTIEGPVTKKVDK